MHTGAANLRHRPIPKTGKIRPSIGEVCAKLPLNSGEQNLRRRELDGCPVAGALQLIGDKWTMLIVRELAGAARRTTELIDALFPISSRTLVDRLRDMEKDDLVERFEQGGMPVRVEYSLTKRGKLLLPLLEALRVAGEVLECNQCDDRKNRLGFYCEICPLNAECLPPKPKAEVSPFRRPAQDDSIVLL